MRGKFAFAAALVAALIAVPVLTQAHGGKRGCDGGHGGWFHGGTELSHLEQMADRFDFTDEQRAKVRAISDKYRPQMREIGDRKHAARKEIHVQMKAEKPDAAKIVTAAEAKGKAEGEMMVLRTQIRSEVSGILTPEQRERWMKRGHGRFHKDGKGSGAKDRTDESKT